MKKTRKEALQAGDKFYKTGKKCCYGHISTRQTISGNCTECLETTHREARLQYLRQRDPKKVYKYNKSYKDKSMSNASNGGQSWTVKDILLITEKDEKGNYAHKEKWLSEKLGRSVRAISRGRHRYRDLNTEETHN